MPEDDETKKFMKKLVIVITNISKTLQNLQDKIDLSTRQMALLFKQVEGIAKKLGQLDLEVEGEFLKLGKEPKPSQLATNLQLELEKIEKDIESIPDDLLDGELQKLLEEDTKGAKKEDT
ncbi:MAG: hypothetical protein ACTSQI_05440 [Candidatus Helarchaeota archaeon]